MSILTEKSVKQHGNRHAQHAICELPPSLSELTPIIFDMELTHLDSGASMYVLKSFVAN